MYMNGVGEKKAHIYTLARFFYPNESQGGQRNSRLKFKTDLEFSRHNYHGKVRFFK